jgi:hypothetical protein
MHQAAWYKNGLLPYDWSIGVSENGWTNNEIGLTWLKTVFDKYTKNHSVGRYRLLILDGHGSHVTPEFDQYCLDHSIIVVCMPPHSSHLLQPLDVGCFSVLKRSYGKRVETLMSVGVNQIDKQEFLSIYQQARRLYIKTTYEAVLQPRGSFRTIQIAFYRFYTLNIIRLHRNYAHKLKRLGRPKRLTISSN